MSYTLANKNGFTVRFLEWGGSVTEILAADRRGNRENVVLGLPSDEDYEQDHPYFGALVGRYSGRIAEGRFMLDGQQIQLSRNSGSHHIAGGFSGFDKKRWQVEQSDATSASLKLVSPDGDEGFPGTLTVTVRYSISEDDAFRLDYEATTDRATVLNLTNHSYFNLGGEGSATVEDHHIRIASDEVIETDAELIATGRMIAVEGTPLDFRRARRIGDGIRSDHPLTRFAKGYDCSFVLPGQGLRRVAEAYHPLSGRHLVVETTEPSLAFYSGNFLDGSIVGRSGRQYRQGDAFTLEPRHLPNAPNHPHFATTVLRPGATFRATTVYRFRASEGGIH